VFVIVFSVVTTLVLCYCVWFVVILVLLNGIDFLMIALFHCVGTPDFVRRVLIHAHTVLLTELHAVSSVCYFQRLLPAVSITRRFHAVHPPFPLHAHSTPYNFDLYTPITLHALSITCTFNVPNRKS